MRTTARIFSLLLLLLVSRQLSAQHDGPKPWKKYGGKKVHAQPQPYRRIHLIDPAWIRSKCDTNTAFKRADVYAYDTINRDSSLVCRIWFSNDSTACFIKGSFYEAIPFREPVNPYINSDIVAEMKGYASYETCNPMVCEAGGATGYNKYTAHYNASGWADTLRHYEAEYGDGKGGTYEHPAYRLTAMHVYSYTPLTQTIDTYVDEMRLTQRLTRYFDVQGRLVHEECVRPNCYRKEHYLLKTYYVYANR